MVTRQVPDEGTKPIIILSGPPGAGKTTVAQDLIKLMPAAPAYIEGDDFWRFFPGGSKPQKQVNDFRTIMRATTAATIPFAIAGYDTILDFSIPPWYLKGVIKIIHRRAEIHYVVLKPDESICARRALERGGGPITDYDHEFYESFDKSPVPIITDVATPMVIAQQIYQGLQEGIFFLRY